MKNKYFIALLLLFITFQSAKPTSFNTTGEVVDSIGEPEMYATLRIFSETDSVKPVAIGTTGTDGRFSQELPSAGKYRLLVAATGKSPFKSSFEVTDSLPTADMGTIVLTENDVALQEITVTALRPLVKREIDRLSYDVKADPEQAGSNLRDILRKVPMVTVDPDGTIRINGKTDFKIYKNGRPNNGYSNNAKDIFAAIPASSIKRIEVITDPGVREDAEGSSMILNIVTDSQTALKGVLGQVSAQYNLSSNTPNLSGYLTSQIDRVTFNVYGSYFHSPHSRMTKGHQERTTQYLATGNTMHTRHDYVSTSDHGYYGAEASWEPDTLRLLTIEASGWNRALSDTYDMSLTHMTDAAGEIIQRYRSNSNPDLKNSMFIFDGAANYQRMTRRKGETITLSYNISASSDNNTYYTVYDELIGWTLPYTEMSSLSRTYFTEQTLQADWTRPYFSNSILDIGAKAILRRNHAISNMEYVGAGTTADDFIHRTTVAGIYADYRMTLGKWNLRAGIRYEYSYLSAKFLKREGYGDEERPDFHNNINDWVPNASIMWQPADAHSLKLSYQRTVRRPGINYLDPTTSVGPHSVSYGNPDLENSAFNNLNFEYQYLGPKINVMFYASGMVNNNSIGQIQWLGGEDGQTVYSTYGNVVKRRSLDFSLYLGGSLWPKSRLNVGFNTGWDHWEQPSPLNDEGKTVRLSRARWWMNPYIYISQQLPWKLNLSVIANYWSGSLNNVYSYDSRPFKDNIWYSLTLSRSFLKDDRLNIQLSAQNPFGPGGQDYNTYVYAPDRYTVAHDWHTSSRAFSIRVSWRFGSLKASVRKTDKSISNDDMVGGKGKG